MTKILSDSFFGDKILKQNHYSQLKTTVQLDLLKQVFHQWIYLMAQANPELEQILLDFLVLNIKKSIKMGFQFQKFSSFIELSAKVFENSFKNHLSKQESFALFRDVIVRHSLFRPPYSVKIFQTEEVRQLTKFWIQTFDRYFDLYESCFGRDLDRQIETYAFAGNLQEKQISKSKQIVLGQSALEALLQKLQIK